MREPNDLYETLRVHPSAEPEVIEAAYRRLVRMYHPDVNTSPEASDIMKRLNHAYSVLNDPEKRAAYDRQRNSPPPPRPGGRRTGRRPTGDQSRQRAAPAQSRPVRAAEPTSTGPPGTLFYLVGLVAFLLALVVTILWLVGP